MSYLLYLAEQDDGDVRKDMWTIWLNDMAQMFTESGQLTRDQCITYLVALLTSYQDA
jgi:hypothetical protein